MDQQVRSIMTSNVVTIHESQSVQEAANLMSQHNIGSIPVVDQYGQMVGIITDRDITLRSTAQGEPTNLSVSEVMTAQRVVQATPEMNIEQAAQLMSEQQIRRLPVVENGQVVGMVSLGDLAVNRQHDQKAGQALASISTPSAPQNQL